MDTASRIRAFGVPVRAVRAHVRAVLYSRVHEPKLRPPNLFDRRCCDHVL